MSEKTKIGWCDSTWNPVTGCLHGCTYCYARRIAGRFCGNVAENLLTSQITEENGCFALKHPFWKSDQHYVNPYPAGFLPTFHRYRLDEPKRWKKPRTIFVCSMADLFGEWVPMDWKIEVLLACREAPQHRYLFLTKDPRGYALWSTEKHSFKTLPVNVDSNQLYTDNMWLGVTYTGRERLPGTTFDPSDWRDKMGIGTNFWYLWKMSGPILPFARNKFLSIEPISCDITEIEDERNPGEKLLEKFICGEDKPFPIDGIFNWVIVGAETGNRKGKIVPQKAWIDKLATLCDRAGVPIFMKESLRDLMGCDFRQEFPWGDK